MSTDTPETQSPSGQDLLSAALDESGLGMELNDFIGLQGQNFAGNVDEKILQGLSLLQNQRRALAAMSPGTNPSQRPLTSFLGLSPFLNPDTLTYDSKPTAAQMYAAAAMKGQQGLYSGKLPSNGGLGLMGMMPAVSRVDVSKLWNTDDVKLRMPMFANALSDGVSGKLEASEGPEGDDDDDEDELGHAETYADYMPSKLKVGEKHPDPVVETNSLSSVQPPDVWYRLSIPEDVIDYCYLSALQLEAIVYASQQHEQLLPDGSRAGFLVGDGAGVGKGRTIAGIIHENYLLGRKRAIWISVSNDLKYDAVRDLKDIGAGKIEVHPLNKMKYAKLSSKVNGSVKKGIIFSTYSSLIGESQSGGKYKTRLKQLLHWCGEDFDGVIVFDECHKAKNLCPVGSAKPTKTGLTVLELQNKVPKARVVYASATGASEPKNMAYMTRLGLWGIGTPFREFSEFIQAVERRGVGAMEVVAMDMKLRGSYIARQLSFAGVTFKIEEIPLSKEFIRVYDESVKLWVDARDKFQQSVVLVDGEQRMKKTMWGQFWSAHQRFFKYMCIASKVDYAVRLAREAVKDGKCVVIGLQSTGEARTLEQLEEAGGELNDFVSTAKGVFQTLVEKHFPAPDRKRIHRLLGLDSLVDMSALAANDDKNARELPSTSSGIKRKSERKARQGSKRYREEKLSDESDSEGQDSDFVMSESNSSEEESNFESSEPSDSEDQDSDFNPFGDGSDSEDDDPWLSRKSKAKKRGRSAAKKKKKKHNPWAKSCSKNKYNGDGRLQEGCQPPPKDAIERACSMKEELLARIEELGSSLPPNTLDQLIDDLGGPDNVAEMTGRKGRVVSTDDGGVQYESRSEVDVPLETLNITEKQRFMDGEKHIAIISEAASSGISLQSDRRAKNQRRRVHITLELPWSADRAIQQFGRTHRSNQVNAPEYMFLISDLAGERRFASIVAKRLESLGALTHGDRRATESRDLSQFNIDNKYGRAALEAVMKSIMGFEAPIVPPPSDYNGNFFRDVRLALIGVGLVTQDERCLTLFGLDKDYNNMSKFLNRILGIQVELQNRLFKYFSDTLSAIITQAKKAGRFDLGILDLGTSGDQVKRLKCDTFLIKHATGTSKIELHTVSVERGMTWTQAMAIWAELTGTDEGFYVSHIARNGKYTGILAVCNATASRKKDKKDKSEKLYSIYRPNTGLQMRLEGIADLKKKYKKVVPDKAQPHWQSQYDSASLTCSHAYWRGSCRSVILGLPCDMGLRRKMYHILSGSVLSVWSSVESVMSSMPGGHGAKLQVIRVRTEDGLRIVGSVIPLNCYAPLINVLAQECTKTYTEAF